MTYAMSYFNFGKYGYYQTKKILRVEMIRIKYEYFDKRTSPPSFILQPPSLPMVYLFAKPLNLLIHRLDGFAIEKKFHVDGPAGRVLF